jgi:hypothetical protein
MNKTIEGFTDGMAISLEESLTDDLKEMKSDSSQWACFGDNLDKIYWYAIYKVVRKKMEGMK